ncbi:unnamed protein product [Sphenostylis stenocarpa]|uniref:LOB domain-containing protein n=1 Tax=Sphenostylis stenocarpa TaxID=92480 RepID=A0AA86SBW7_9FABA|nr:unnamed protein product [Sphenostylis stenocarpa]
MTPCGACKYQRRRCGQYCLLAPYFPAENIQQFAYVHHVFGGGNVSNILKSTKLEMRMWVVRALAYQAEARVRDPVHGCVGVIREQEENLRILKEKLEKAQRELAQYLGPEVVRKLSPRYDGPSVTVDDVDLSSPDPFPSWEPTSPHAASSSRMHPPHSDAGNVKGKSVAPPS